LILYTEEFKVARLKKSLHRRYDAAPSLKTGL
jgi:hypothetical protein